MEIMTFLFHDNQHLKGFFKQKFPDILAKQKRSLTFPDHLIFFRFSLTFQSSGNPEG